MNKKIVINLIFLIILYVVVWGNPVVVNAQKTLNSNMYVAYSKSNENYVLDISAYTDNLITYSYHGLGNQLFLFNYRSEKDGYIIQAAGNEQKLLKDNSTENIVTAVKLDKVVNSLSVLEDELIWDIKKVSGNYYSISNRKSGLCITISDLGSNADISLKPFINNVSQLFKIETMLGVYTIRNRYDTEQVWDIQGGVGENRDIIPYSYGGLGKKNQEWFVLYKPNDNDYVLSNAGNKQLIVSQNSASSAATTVLNTLAFTDKYDLKNLLRFSKETAINGDNVVTIRNEQYGSYYTLTDSGTINLQSYISADRTSSEQYKQHWILDKIKELEVPVIDNIKVTGPISGESSTFFAGEKLVVDGRYSDSEFKSFDLYAKYDVNVETLIYKNMPIANGTKIFSTSFDTSNYKDGNHFLEFSARGDGMFQSNRVALKYTIIYPTPIGKPNPQIIKQYTDINSLKVSDFVTDLTDEIGSTIEISELNLDTSIEGDQMAVVSIKNKYKTVKIDVPVTIVPDPIVTTEYFENQAWLIGEINKQLSPKKIDKDVYMTDLLKITSIVNRSGADFKGQHIPKTIASLKNLQEIDLKNKYLIGMLPDELGSLSKLKKLSIFGNSFTGEIPRSLSKLEKLEFLAFDDNKLSGTIPPGLENITTLRQIYLNKNNLVGIVPTFNLGPFYNFHIGETQLTYNDNKSPSFISKAAQYQQSFVVGTNSLSLTGNTNLVIANKEMLIRPFDFADEGFLNLHAQKKDRTNVALYSGHTFKIMNKKSGQVLYNGPEIKDLEIKVNPAEIHQVIMDDAGKNPNNVFEFKPNLREYKLSEVPKTMSLDLKIGDLNYQPVKISRDDSLSIFDNRVDNQWQLKVKVYPLQNKTKRLAGDFFYKGSDAIPKILTASRNFHVIESGKSNPNSETIDLGKEWDENRGLFYKQTSTANYKNSYTGKFEWQMVDAPAGR
ncbi:hypothetical protein IGJ02_002208 [Enterococcus sp. DIV0724b]|uniref:RICIN domain-containing protein n=1 Tax=Enterococcus sp. DIV0724b TaxID=2774694 RepID=UPI003D3003F3